MNGLKEYDGKWFIKSQVISGLTKTMNQRGDMVFQSNGREVEPVPTTAKEWYKVFNDLYCAYPSTMEGHMGNVSQMLQDLDKINNAAVVTANNMMDTDSTNESLAMSKEKEKLIVMLFRQFSLCKNQALSGSDVSEPRLKKRRYGA